jgi:hypothetical protein
MSQIPLYAKGCARRGLFLSRVSDERHNPPPLTAARPVRRELAMKGICFFFQARTALEKEKERGKEK